MEKKKDIIPQKGITKISVKGFKSLLEETKIEIRPLTILAGSNNSGKSSVLQPLLMMKQTIEEAIEPVSDLDIDGNHVSYSTPEEFLTIARGKKNRQFTIQVDLDANRSIVNVFKRSNRKLIELAETVYRSNNGDGEEIIVNANLKVDELIARNPALKIFEKSLYSGFNQIKNNDMDGPSKELTLNDLGMGLCVRRKRCLLGLAIDKLDPDSEGIIDPVFLPVAQEYQQLFERYILDIIHVPADRGSPERSYRIFTVGKRYRGPINSYVASILYNWKQTGAPELKTLKKWLRTLELTADIDTDHCADNRIKILVHRLTDQQSDSLDTDMVNLADVGFGTSQVLVVLVAMLAAKPNQLVYLEQPEVHLHPKAQYKLASCIAEAVKRGIHVVVETHSEMLLIGIQTLVAGEKLSPDDVILHWFERKAGVTKVRSGAMDDNGAYGEWPVDFANISYEANREYLKATGFLKR